MQVTTTNDVKVYNLSAGRSLPEWISERKRRTLLKKDVCGGALN
jgi:ribosome biogenesis protein ENP2